MRNTCDAEVVSGGDINCNLRGIHADFASFRSEHALLKAHLPRSDVNWEYYQAGPATDAEPIVFLHGTSGTAAMFFYQVRLLAAKGYRVISAQYPAYDNPEEWCKGMDHFLDTLRCRAAHIFGAGLGGYLAQHFAGRYSHRVRSLILCNAFASTKLFAATAGALISVVHITPTALLRKVIWDSFPQAGLSLESKQAIDFVAGQVNEISGTDLAGRLSLNSTESCAPPVNVESDRITVMESSGETMVPDELRREVQRRYASSRVAELKSGGDFPFLSRPEEVALFIEVHMRGVGVYGSGIAPALNSDFSDDQSRGRSNGGSSHWEPPRRQEDETDVVVNTASPAPEFKPKWKNPFEDDDLL